MAYSSGMSVLLGLTMLAFWLYCLFDVITTPDEKARNLPKLLWVVIVVVTFVVGGLFWLLLGRPLGPRPPRPTFRPDLPQRPDAPRGPDDDPDFLRDLDRRLRDED
ncbi:hypothetical protein Psi01_15850 [Planobispora siamensis]|uniref:Cardiolipin synthase N-terminal domain-containing protein n=2 Tax=Planobispora siamensis TaxID=936338 RepID=A0A8J3SEB2_9ACTN|nr:hypothetical protein Psi01_15850 [Planobispora siamensis]